MIRSKRVFFISVLSLFITGILSAQTSNAGRYTASSVLASGHWLKIKVGSTGIYKLTYSDLKNMGISDPKNVQIYGYGGWLLDEDFTKPYTDDLPQIAVWMSKPRAEFGEGDYLLFYARGDIKWEYDPNKKEFLHTQHLYSKDSYYFVTESAAGPLLMNEVSSTYTGSFISNYTEYYLHENDLINLEKSGREFYGEDFNATPSQNFTLNLPGAEPQDAQLRVSFIAKLANRDVVANLSVKQNGSELKAFKIPFTATTIADEVNDVVQFNNLSGTGTLNFSTTGSIQRNRYLNYFKLEYSRRLKPYGGVTLFRNEYSSAGDLGYLISDVSDKYLVFDVSNAVLPQRIKTNLSGTEMRFGASNNTVKEYALVNTAAADIPTPTFVSEVPNQNLHALPAKEMVIIVSSLLEPYAEQLAQIHYDDSGLESVVVTAEEIYNEFSSGKPDVTAYRRFLKMFYDRDPGTSPQYLMLFGDGTYDNRFIENPWDENHKKAMLLTYQSQNTLTSDASMVTDDYIGFLDDDEKDLASSVLDIGIGRLPVRTTKEARDVVAKIKAYVENKDKGIWQNNIAFVADDAIAGNESRERFHCLQADGIAELLKTGYPEFIANKLYMDNYVRRIVNNFPKYTDGNRALIDKLNSGLLVLNYVGHGSTAAWAESILDLIDIQNMTNKHLPLWITATCDFSRYDAYATSGGEMAFLNPDGGAIALISTTRLVYSAFNDMLNKSVFKYIFEEENNQPLRLGDILRKAKVSLGSQQNKLKFALIGDPALRLSYPGNEYRVELKNINGANVSATANIQFKPLSGNVIKGAVVKTDGQTATEFTGKLDVVIFDNELSLKTRGNKLSNTVEDVSVTYKDYPQTLYSATVTVTNGEFSIHFVTPLDILHDGKNGRMSFYAYSEDGKEAQGSFLNYNVGGETAAITETTPPVIRQLYLNDANFLPGDKVNMTPVFSAEIYDDTDVNLSSAIGHNISLTIDDHKSYNLSSNFMETSLTESETGALGVVNFVIPGLTAGQHTLRFKVWDVFNNSTVETINFECVEKVQLPTFGFEIQNNPATTSAQFIFRSELSYLDAELKYEVYSSDGVLLWEHKEAGLIESLSDRAYQWNLIASNGTALQPGMYVCRMSISVNGQVKSSKSEKLVVVKQ